MPDDPFLIDLWVPCIPTSKGSYRAINNRATGKAILVPSESDDQAKRLRAMTKAVREATAQWKHEHGHDIPWDHSLGLELWFVLPRPESVNRARRYARGKPDRDKLERALCDAIAGDKCPSASRLVTDDARFVTGPCHKVYAGTVTPDPGVRIRIWTVRDV